MAVFTINTLALFIKG